MSQPTSNRVRSKQEKADQPVQKQRAIPEKCRLCAKLTAQQAKQKHGSEEGDGCWDSSVCPNTVRLVVN